MESEGDNFDVTQFDIDHIKIDPDGVSNAQVDKIVPQRDKGNIVVEHMLTDSNEETIKLVDVPVPNNEVVCNTSQNEFDQSTIKSENPKDFFGIKMASEEDMIISSEKKLEDTEDDRFSSTLISVKTENSFEITNYNDDSSSFPSNVNMEFNSSYFEDQSNTSFSEMFNEDSRFVNNDFSSNGDSNLMFDDDSKSDSTENGFSVYFHPTSDRSRSIDGEEDRRSLSSESNDRNSPEFAEYINENSEDMDLVRHQKEADKEFNWDEYLELSNLEPVPLTAFLHVEKSEYSGIEEKQVLEVVHEENCYWPAAVVSVCGNLLRLKYMLSEGKDIWKDIQEGCLFGIGQCKEKSYQLKPPDDYFDDPPDLLTLESLIKTSTSVPILSLDASDQLYSVVDDIKIGMKVELLKEYSACGQICEVSENKKGRLALKSCCSDALFTVFFTSTLLKPLGWIEQHLGIDGYNCCDKGFTLEDKKLHLEAQRTLIKDVFPSLFLENIEVKKHNLKINTFFEVINPITKHAIHAAKVVNFIDDELFEFKIYSKSDIMLSTFTTTINDPLVLQPGFCKKNNLTLIVPEKWCNSDEFTWEDNKLISMEDENFSLLDKNNEITPNDSLDFCSGQILEITNPNENSEICTGIIDKIIDNLLFIKLDKELCEELIIVPTCSSNIFPAGWALTHNCDFIQPSDHRLLLNKCSSNISPNKVNKEKDKCDTSLQESVWCPKIYINHFCQCGPFLNRKKIVKKSKFIGPGPVEWILKDVITNIISSAYIPTKTLRQIAELKPHNPSWHPVAIKAKNKRHSMTGNVVIATRAADIPQYLRAVFKILQCCPNLWSFSSTGDVCPHKCHPPNSSIPNLTKKNQNSNIIQDKGSKRGHKRLLDLGTSRMMTDQFDDDNNDGDEEGIASGSEEADDSRWSCPSSPQLSPRTKKRRSDVPPIQIEEVKKEGKLISQGYIKPAKVDSDPIEWSIEEVEKYISNQPAISHHALKLKNQEVDGPALLLLNLPTLIHHFNLVHSSAVVLAEYICKIKLAHYLHRQKNELK